MTGVSVGQIHFFSTQKSGISFCGGVVNISRKLFSLRLVTQGTRLPSEFAQALWMDTALSHQVWCKMSQYRTGHCIRIRSLKIPTNPNHPVTWALVVLF